MPVGIEGDLVHQVDATGEGGGGEMEGSHRKSWLDS